MPRSLLNKAVHIQLIARSMLGKLLWPFTVDPGGYFPAKKKVGCARIRKASTQAYRRLVRMRGPHQVNPFFPCDICAHSNVDPGQLTLSLFRLAIIVCQ